MKDKKHFYTSINLKQHPIFKMTNNQKNNYIKALSFFTYKYNGDNEYCKKVLERYNKELNDNKEIVFEEKNIKRLMKKTCSFKIDGFKLITYRYVFIVDCLFINAIDNPLLAKKIIKDIKSLFNKKYYKKINSLYNILFKGEEVTNDFKLAGSQIKNWKENRGFLKQEIKSILVTANMSSGKSTLINSVIGKKVALTKSEACTAKVNFYYNKCSYDEYIMITDKDSVVYTDRINSINNSQSEQSISAFGLQCGIKGRLKIIDTPGVNSSLNIDHKEETVKAIKTEKYEKVLYVINANSIGVDDDIKHLKYVYENIKDKEIIFVLNKLDTYRLSEDSIEESINNLKNDLLAIGFNNPRIYPLSAYAAFLFKKIIAGDKLSDEEEMEASMLLRKFKKEKMNLGKYNKIDKDIKIECTNSFDIYKPDEIVKCLINTGIVGLEKVLMENGEV